MTRPRKSGQPHKGWKSSARKRHFQPAPIEQPTNILANILARYFPGPEVGQIWSAMDEAGITVTWSDSLLSKTLSEGEKKEREPVAEIHSGSLRWLVCEDHPAQSIGHAYLYIAEKKRPQKDGSRADDGSSLSPDGGAV